MLPRKKQKVEQDAETSFSGRHEQHQNDSQHTLPYFQGVAVKQNKLEPLGSSGTLSHCTCCHIQVTVKSLMMLAQGTLSQK